ncbi:MAG: hypothetical protein SF123_16155 [Chloroflexota bacterium]|nr:hypothetical protein [Chloroflexota bacterium]
MTKPPRTIGITFAILASVCLFSCLPLTQAVILFSLASRSTLQFPEPSTVDVEVTPVFQGSSLIGLESPQLIIQIVLAIIFLIIGILAWRGKPPYIRLVFMATVLLLSAGNIALLYTSLTALPNLATGFDSAADIARQLNMTYLCVSLAIPMYVVWYMSRGPARAFYRGHYLQAPETSQ